MEQKNASPSSLVVGVVVVLSVLFSFVSPCGTGVGVDAVVGLAGSVASFVSPWVGGAAAGVAAGAAGVAAEVVETKSGAVPTPT